MRVSFIGLFKEKKAKMLTPLETYCPGEPFIEGSEREIGMRCLHMIATIKGIEKERNRVP